MKNFIGIYYEIIVYRLILCVFTLITLIKSDYLQSQQISTDWSINFGGQNNTSSMFKSMDVDENGNSFVVGSFSFYSNFYDNSTDNVLFSEGSMDGYISKYSSNGDLLWVTQVESTQSCDVSSIEYNPNGYIIVSGDFKGSYSYGDYSFSSENNTQFSSFLLKINSDNGELIWSKEYTPNSTLSLSIESKHLKIDSSQNIYHLTRRLKNNGKYGSHLFKLDNSGNLIFDGFIKNVIPTGLEVFSDDSFIVGGDFIGQENSDFILNGDSNTYYSGNNINPVIIKYDSNGSLVFNINIEEETPGMFVGGLYVDIDSNNFFVSLYHGPEIDINPNGNSIFVSPYQGSTTSTIIEYNSNGLVENHHTIKGSGFNLGSGTVINFDMNDTYFLINYSVSGQPNLDFYGGDYVPNSDEQNREYVTIYDKTNLQLVSVIKYNVGYLLVNDNLYMRNYNKSLFDSDNNLIIGSTTHFLYLEDNVIFPYTQGSNHSSSITKINLSQVLNSKPIQTSNINLYPNPTNDILNIDIEDYKSSELFNISGQSILKTDEKSLDLSKFSNGVYFLTIEKNDGIKTKGIKVLKE